MSKITSIKAIQVLDSRGLPTIACRITLDNALTAGVMVPSGASTGAKEAIELRAVSYTHLTLPTKRIV